MIQTSKTLSDVVKEFNKFYDKIELAPIQKAQISPNYLVLSVRFPGKTVFLAIGLGNRFEGLYLSELNLPSVLRQKDKFLDFCRKNLVDSRMAKIEKLEDKRAVRFSLYKNGKVKFFDLCWYERDLYFSIYEENDESWKHFSSFHLERTVNSPSSLLSVFSELNSKPDKQSEDKVQDFWIDFKLYQKNIFNSNKILEVPKKKKKFLENKVKNIENDLEKFSKRNEIKNQLISDQIVLNNNFYNLCGVKIKFNEDENIYQRKDKVFQKIKSLDSVEKILLERLNDSKELLEKNKNSIVEESKVSLPVQQLIWPKNKTNKKTELKFNVREITLDEKIKCIVGLDAQSNDEIRKNAKKDFLWFHTETGQSCHLIVNVDSFSMLSAKNLRIIGALVAKYSGINAFEINLMYSPVKDLKGVKGSPGKVILKKPKYLTISFDNSDLNLIN